MSTTVTLNNTSFDIPAVGEDGWGDEVSAYLIAISAGVLQKSGGTFTLTAPVNLGPAHGLKSIYYQSQAAAPALTGEVRLGNVESIVWRDAANTTDLALSVNATDNLEFNGVELAAGHLGTADTVLTTDATATGQAWIKLLDANIDAAAAISWSKISKAGSDLTDLATRSHTVLSDIGTNTHAQIDTAISDSVLHIADTTNPHSVTKTQVGLDQVDNTSDATKDAAATTLTNKTVVVSANTITTAASGNLAATELNAALSELQTDIDTRALDADLTSHESATTGTHGVTGTIVGTIDVQVLTNKDIDGTWATNTNRITLPKGSRGTLDALTRKEGTLVYDVSSDSVLVDDGVTLNAIKGAGGGGGGAPNAVLNPHATVDTAGYVPSASGAPALYRIGSDGPLAPVVETGLNIFGGDPGGYLAYPFKMPDVFKNAVRRLTWVQSIEGTFPAYTAGGFKVELWSSTALGGGTYTRVPLYSDVGGVTSIPAITGPLEGMEFTAGNQDYYEIRWVRVSGSTAIYITGVSVEMGIPAKGAIVGEWESYTPADVSGLGIPPTVVDCKQRRVGSSVELSIKLRASGPTGTAVFVSLPSGLTGDAGGVNLPVAGNAFTTYSGADSRGLVPAINGAGDPKRLQISWNNTSASIYTALNGNQLTNASDWLYINATVPILEWRGSGTTYMGSNDVEYYSNDGTSTVISPDGSLVPNLAADTPSSYNISTATSLDSSGGIPVIQFKSPDTGSSWVSAPTANIAHSAIIDASNTENGKQIGAMVKATGASLLNVRFGNWPTGGTSFGAGSSSWATLRSAGWRWRVVKARAGIATNFGLATPTVAGLVSGGTVPGSTSGAAIGAGYIGEVLTSFVTTATNFGPNGTWFDATSLELKAGIWSVSGSLNWFGNGTTLSGGNLDLELGILTEPGASTSGLSFGVNGSIVYLVPVSGYGQHSLSTPTVIVRSDGTNYTIVNGNITKTGSQLIRLKTTTANYTGTTPQYQCSLIATRIA